MRPVTVLVAEDSVTKRELIVSILRSEPAMEVIGEAKNGEEAVEMTIRLRPDVVTMDIYMPLIDGFEATKRIMREAPTPIVIVSDAPNVKQVEISMRALAVGATMVLRTPPGRHAPEFEVLSQELVHTVRAVAGLKLVQALARSFSGAAGGSKSRPSAIAIAASTGGPTALQRILAHLPADFPIPILLVQHISAGFVQGFAAWLDTITPLRIRISEDGEPLEPHTVYLAPENTHLGASAPGRVRLSKVTTPNLFRPSADILFGSMAEAFGAAAYAVILTGMGQDGVEGLRHIRSAGGLVLAQDEASSVVFGMPRAAIEEGLANLILPLSYIGPHLLGLARAEAP